MQGLDEELRGLTLRRMLYCFVAFGTPLFAMFGFCATYAMGAIAGWSVPPDEQFRYAIGGALAFAAIMPLGALALARYMPPLIEHSNAAAAAEREGDDELMAEARARAAAAAVAIGKRMRREILMWGIPIAAALGFASSYGYDWLYDRRLSASDSFVHAVSSGLTAVAAVLVAYLVMLAFDRLRAGYIVYRESQRV